MNTSDAIFKTVAVLTATLAALLLFVYPFQEPGSGSRVITVVTLTIQFVLLLVSGAGLYYGWEPFRGFDE